MTNNAIDAIYVMNYFKNGAGHQWSNLPDDLWWSLVSNLDILNVDGIGFQNILSSDALPKQLANRLKPEPGFIGTYQPYHADSSLEVAVFDLTQDVQCILLSKHFDQWNRANEQLPFDEVCFFRGERILIQVVAYENMILFYSLSRGDLQTLVTVDARFRNGLYCKDLHELVSFPQ